MHILLPSARAPVTLELARRFTAAGATVFLCDSLKFGCATFSRFHRRCFRTPRPRQAPIEYIDALCKIVEREKIDLLIPTCEEVFYIAAHRERIPCDVFVDSLATLDRTHNKWIFSQTASNDAAQVPVSHLISSHRQLQEFHDRSTEFVFKPVYSRFASETLIAPPAKRLATLDISGEKPWIAQRRIFGTEVSTYSVARSGKLLAHVAYVSDYRAGRGSGIYFHNQEHPRITEFVERFVAERSYTGQIGFDCIVDNDDQPWIIEGNPRATSGLHLFDDDASLIEAMIGKCASMVETKSTKPRMVAGAMLLWGAVHAIRHRRVLKYVGDYWQGRDVLFQWNDPIPLFALPITMAELIWISVREWKTLQQAATHDIEWNGQAI